MSDDGIVSSLKYLFADFLDEVDTTPPYLPDGLPEGAVGVVSDGIHRLMDYQGATYATLYVERLQRFIDKGLEAIEKNLARQIASGKITEEDRKQTLARIRDQVTYMYVGWPQACTTTQPWLHGHTNNLYVYLFYYGMNNYRNVWIDQTAPANRGGKPV